MKKLILFFCIVLFTGFILNAQSTDSLRYKYTNQTIYRYGNSFMKGTERLRFRDLKAEFSISNLGMASYTKAKQYRTISFVLRFVSLAANIAVLAMVSNRNLTGNQRTLAYGFLGGDVLLNITAGKYYQLSTQSLDRALWQRNKDLLFPAR